MLSTLLATALACAVLLPLLGHRALADWDEGIYAEVSREMLSGSWLVTHWNGLLWFEKPPLTLWITAIFFRLFGVTEFWARAGSAFSGVALVAVLHAWLARRQDRWAAWLCTVLLLSTFGFLHICRVGETDTLLSLGCIIAVLGLAEVQLGNPRAWLLFWCGFAVALMTKGAASTVLLLTLVSFLVTTPQPRTRANLHPFLLGFVLFLCATLPWHLLMLHRFGNNFVAEYFGLHVLHRATTQIESHRTRWWYYLKVLAVSAPSLLLLALPALPLARRDARVRIFALFSGVVILAFSVVQTRLPHYIAPVYPALAVMAACRWASPLRRFCRLPRPGSTRVVAVAAAIVLFAFPAWVTAPARKRLHAPILGDGSPAPDNRESAALLKRVLAHPVSIPGPLLLWRRPHLVPIASTIFYARRSVQRVQPDATLPGTVRDKYLFDPQSLDEALIDGPRLLLLDRALLPLLPSRYGFTQLDASPTLAFGTVDRVGQERSPRLSP